jgi:hypothetical protein
MRPHDMKYIGFKHQRENKQNSDNTLYQSIIQTLLIGFYQYTSKQLDIKETAGTASSVSFLRHLFL